MSLRLIAFIIFNIFLFLILAFYYKLFFIQIPKVRDISTGSPYSEIETLTPVHWPNLIINGSFNRQFGSDFWRFMIYHFIGTLSIKTLEVKTFFNIFIGIVSDRVLRGKNGFFFYISKYDGDNLRDFFKQNLANQLQLNNAMDKILDIMNFCSSLNISFLLIIGPNKHSIYSEYYPVERPPGITRTDQLSQVFTQLKIPFVFPRDFLIEKKKISKLPLYYETDTHWNMLGAYYASILVKEKIYELFPHLTFPRIKYNVTAKRVTGFGDIVDMTPLINKNKTHCTIVHVVPEKGSTAANYIITDMMNRTIKTKGVNQSLPRALIYRDSFFSVLEPFISPLFSQAEYVWKKLDKNHVAEVKPDLLIWETVERSTRSFL